MISRQGIQLCSSGPYTHQNLLGTGIPPPHQSSMMTDELSNAEWAPLQILRQRQRRALIDITLLSREHRRLVAQRTLGGGHTCGSAGKGIVNYFTQGGCVLQADGFQLPDPGWPAPIFY